MRVQRFVETARGTLEEFSVFVRSTLNSVEEVAVSVQTGAEDER